MEILCMHRFPHSYRYIHNPGPAVCGTDQEVDLLVMVASALGHQDRRDTIRYIDIACYNTFNMDFMQMYRLGSSLI